MSAIDVGYPMQRFPDRKNAPSKTRKIAPKDRPPPITGGHKGRALLNRAQTTAMSFVIGGHVFLLAWVAAYYLGFEVVHPIKAYWDTLLSMHLHLLSQDHWDTWRHLFRNGGESYLATLGFTLFVYNPFAHSVRKLDSAGQIIGRCVLALVVAIPVFIAGGLAVHAIQTGLHTGVLAPTVGAHPNLAQKLYSDSWTTKIVSGVAALVGAHFILPPVYDYVVRYFAERKVASGKHAHFWHAPAYQALVHELYHAKGDSRARATARQAARGSHLNRLLAGGTFVVICLAIYGGYILTHN